MSGIGHRYAVRMCGRWRASGERLSPPAPGHNQPLWASRRASAIRLCDLAIDQVEIVLPVRPVRRLLPRGPDRRAVIAERPREALPEARSLPPHLPGALAEAHLVHA